MKRLFQFSAAFFDLTSRAVPRLRAVAAYARTGIPFRRVGHRVLVRGSRRMTVGSAVCLGNYCWVEAVTRYAGKDYAPELIIGDRVAVSDLTHISCARRIRIGNDCLLGSKVYIGDHSHGSIANLSEIRDVPPARRPLGDVAEIEIGEKTWICDGAVILAGSRIGPCSIVGANSVVRVREERPALIAGVPAKVIRYLDGE